LRGERRVWETVARDIFLCALPIAWDSQGIRGNAQNDAETIDLGFRPKIELGLWMRPRAIVAATGHVTK